jgi:dTDP-4-amino-4,6-dideoxygalactose transaminase
MPDYDVLGYNYRMTDIQGALGVVQLGKLDRLIDERDEAVKKYESGLSGIPWLRLPARPSDSRHAWQAYVTYVDADRAPISRNRIMEGLERRGIATRPGTHADQNSMALPLHNRMVPEDFEHVIAVLNEF